MLGSVALLALHAAVVVRAGPETACPSSRQLSDALAERLPGQGAGVGEPLGPGALTLLVEPDGPDGASSVTLSDRDGQVRLRRTLPAPGPVRERDCPALAQTVSLMVERYLQGVKEPEQPAPAVQVPFPVAMPAQPRWHLGLRAGWRPGPGWTSGADILAALRRAVHASLTLGVAAGVGGASDHRWGAASGRLRRFPAELELGWGRRAGPGLFQLAATAGLDLWLLTASAQQSSLHPAPSLGTTLAYQIPVSARTFVRVVGGGAYALKTFTFAPEDMPALPAAFATARLYGKLAIEAGVAFR